jgi:hypothetical protein
VSNLWHFFLLETRLDGDFFRNCPKMWGIVPLDSRECNYENNLQMIYCVFKKPVAINRVNKHVHPFIVTMHFAYLWTNINITSYLLSKEVLHLLVCYTNKFIGGFSATATKFELFWKKISFSGLHDTNEICAFYFCGEAPDIIVAVLVLNNFVSTLNSFCTVRLWTLRQEKN